MTRGAQIQLAGRVPSIALVTLGLVALGLVGPSVLLHVGSPVQAATIVHPPRPVDTMPLEIVIDEVGPPISVEHRDTLVDLDAQTILVRFDIRAGVLAPPRPSRYLHHESLEPLPVGLYSLRVEGLEFGTEQVLDVPVERMVSIERGATLEVPAVVSSHDATVPMRFEVFAGCGSVEALEVDAATRTVRIVFLPDCPITPPPPPIDFEVPVDLPGPFAPGEWTVELAYENPLGGFTPRAEARFVAVADPLELGDGRFAVEVTWEDFDGGVGRGLPVQPPSRDAGLIWFFDRENTELMVKVLDACDVNGHFWALTAGSTNVAYALTITDRETGAEWQSSNPLGRLAPAVIDVEAFDCSGG
ncbi:MAG: hypothetical protein AAGC60_10570 [Acidobacteriota bacterium]